MSDQDLAAQLREQCVNTARQLQETPDDTAAQIAATAAIMSLVSRLDTLTAALAEAQQHSGRCEKCNQWTCGYCGISDEHGAWHCERCWGFSPLVKAEHDLSTCRQSLAAAQQERDSLRLELQACQHTKQADNAYLIGERDRLCAALEQVRGCATLAMATMIANDALAATEPTR